jgi:hypothetical protein
MNDYPTVQPAFSATQLEPMPTEMPVADIQETIERMGMRYVTDLRALSEELHRFYIIQLTARDEQIVDLSRRLEIAERNRSALEAQIRQLKQASARYVADLQALTEEPGPYLEAPQKGELAQVDSHREEELP